MNTLSTKLKHRALWLAFASLLGPNAFAADAMTLTLEDLKITGDNVEVIENEDGLTLRIGADAKKGGLNPLFEMISPAITGDSYAILGEVSCKGVEEQGYLEMWNHLPLNKGETEIGASFFSRTLGNSGPMKVLSGDEDWRPFILPARIDDGSGRRPLKLTINAILPQGGVVEIRNLRLRPTLGQAYNTRGVFPIVVMTVSATALVFGAVIAITFAKKKKQERELIRIRNIDAV